MALTYLNTSTLSAALNKTDNTFTVASTANIQVGYLLAFPGELMKVQDIPVSGRVVVRRGYEGTHCGSYASGATFYIGSPNDFKRIRDNSLGILGDAATIPDICIPGTRAVDAMGYEYILLDSTATLVPGATVLISKDGLFTASVLTTAGQGSIAITMEDATSDQWCWAMIRGNHSHAKLGSGSSLATSTGVLCAASSVSSPSVGLIAQTTSQVGTSTNMAGESSIVFGMWPNTACTTASTSATSETGYYCGVWLNYPFIQRKITS